MKKQVVVIHGGRTYHTYEDYVQFLKTRKITIDKFKTHKSWRDSLENELGEEFEVLAPKMPNGYNAVYEEWKIWFERMSTFLNDDSIFIGHSLGGIFLAKYFSENVFAKKVKALILVAAPFNNVWPEETLGKFTLPASFEKIANQIKKVYLAFSQDDPVVPFSEANKYKNVLPYAQILAFSGRQHFEQESFPELVDLIKKL